MIITVLATCALLAAAFPAMLYLRNLRGYQPPPPEPSTDGICPRVSVLIPARNEAAVIAEAVESALASRDVELEVLVLDDQSEDATAAVVERLTAQDPRVRLIRSNRLPAGWSGKPHACALLAAQAQYPVLAFLDADVRLAPDALGRMAAFLDSSGADLASGIPRQRTGTFGERLLIPLIHSVLLGFLPLRRMRASRHPAYAAGCGQLFVARQEAYVWAGGHASIRASLHDGLTLPRAFRQAGLRTDLFDATGIATCRMYHGGRQVWRGLAKNATEGLASSTLIVPATLLLFVGQVLPALLLGWVPGSSWPRRLLILSAFACALAPRVAGALRFRQPLLSVLLHPLGVLALLAIQWTAFLRRLRGRPANWRGRLYPPRPVPRDSSLRICPGWTMEPPARLLGRLSH